MSSLSYRHLLNEVKETIIYKDLEESRVAKATGLAPASSAVTLSCGSAGTWGPRLG